MGVLADFIVATKEEAINYDGSNLPNDHIAQYKRFTELELGYLVDVVDGKGIDYESFHDFETVLIEDDGQIVTTLIREDLTSRFSTANDQDLEQWAKVWCTAEELSCQPEDVMPMLKDLRFLSLLARKENKKVYLWNCV